MTAPPATRMRSAWSGPAGTLDYAGGPTFDEAVDANARPRPVASPLWDHLDRLGPAGLLDRQSAADREMLGAGATFAVYRDGTTWERAWPLDVVPRLIAAAEWDVIDAGLTQRLRALNRFIDDVYHEQRAVRDGVVPATLVTGSANFRPECMGIDPPGGIWAHICGSDLVRDEDGTFYVLEDNLRVPSGVSYMLQNRAVVKRVLPDLFRSYSVAPVDPYLEHLRSLLHAVSPAQRDPVVVVLTPGVGNSAHFEHAYLARHLGAELVEAADLVVLDDATLCMRTIGGLERVDVVYRRVDDLFLDAEVFRRDSVVGVPGLLRALRAGTVAVVNAPGAGIADDKAVYGFVPALVRYYLGEEPILPNVPTYWCGDTAQRQHVLDHLGSLVVKPATESGGYGVVIGPRSGADTLTHLTRRIERYPAGWVAQPVVALSTAPTLCDGNLEPRHVDLRPFALRGPDGSYVTRGGLTRVAASAGSLIVNSSQGGGSKDTWVVDGTLPRHDGRSGTGTGTGIEIGEWDAPATGSPARGRAGPGEQLDVDTAAPGVDARATGRSDQ